MGRQSKFDQHREDVLRAIDSLTRREGKPPSMRQVAAETKVSVATLHAYLKKMRGLGLIEWIEGKHRSLRLTPEALAAVGQGSTPPPPPVAAPVVPPASPPTPPPPPAPPVLTLVPPRVDDSVDVGF